MLVSAQVTIVSTYLEHTAPAQMANFCPFHSSGCLWSSEVLSCWTAGAAKVSFRLIFNESCRWNVSVFSNNRYKEYLPSGKVISNRGLFSLFSCPHFRATRESEQELVLMVGLSGLLLLKKCSQFTSLWETGARRHSTRTGKTLAAQLSSFLPSRSGLQGVELSWGTSL